MRTQAIRVSFGAYQDGTWHVATVLDTYDRGVLVNSELQSLSRPDTPDELHWDVEQAVAGLVRAEQQRVAAETAARPRPERGSRRSADDSGKKRRK